MLTMPMYKSLGDWSQILFFPKQHSNLVVRQEKEDCEVIHVRIGTCRRTYNNWAYDGTELHAQDVGCSARRTCTHVDDNMSFVSVVLNTTVSSSVLKKKHLGIRYHRVREAIAAKI